MKICPICGKELKHQGALNLHKWSCSLKQGAKQENMVAVQQVEPGLFQVKECEHEFRFLNLNHPLENKAYQSNYKEVCVKCQQLH